jgi:hypothetical protein
MSSPIQNKINELSKWSDFSIAQKNANEYLGEDAVLFFSPKENKKYRIYDPIKNKWVDFGQMGMEDFTKHKDEERRRRYLARASNIRGNWRDNKYSPNNLSLRILWN